jgi:hypothetical protein
VRTSNLSIAYNTDELSGRPECGLLGFDTDFKGKIYQDPE